MLLINKIKTLALSSIAVGASTAVISYLTRDNTQEDKLGVARSEKTTPKEEKKSNISDIYGFTSEGFAGLDGLDL